MAAPHATWTFDVQDCKVYALTSDLAGASAPVYSAAVDVPGISEISLEPNFVTSELLGDGGTVIAKKGRVDRMNFSCTYGKLSLDVLDVLFQNGFTVTDSGTGASEVATGVLLGTNSISYFKLEALIADVDVDLAEAALVLPKCAVTGGTLLGQSTNEFGQPTFDCEGIRLSSTDEMMSIAFRESAAGLSA